MRAVLGGNSERIVNLKVECRRQWYLKYHEPFASLRGSQDAASRREQQHERAPCECEPTSPQHGVAGASNIDFRVSVTKALDDVWKSPSNGTEIHVEARVQDRIHILFYRRSRIS